MARPTALTIAAVAFGLLAPRCCGREAALASAPRPGAPKTMAALSHAVVATFGLLAARSGGR